MVLSNSVLAKRDAADGEKKKRRVISKLATVEEVEEASTSVQLGPHGLSQEVMVLEPIMQSFIGWR